MTPVMIDISYHVANIRVKMVVVQFDVEAALRRQLVRRLTDKLAATKSNCTTTVKILLLKV
jgi:hypothetical protein